MAAKPPPPRPQKPGKVSVYRAMFKYDAQHADELSFEEGDIIYVSEQGANGWWKATINGKAGLIPGNYVEESAGKAEVFDNPLHEAAKRGNLGFLNECIAMKVSVNGLDKAGSTPLHWAARGGHMDCVERLLAEPNIQLNVQNKLGDTPLHGAAWKGHAEIVSLLLEKGADRSLANEEGKTPFAITNDAACGRLLQERATYAANDYVNEEDDPDSD